MRFESKLRILVLTVAGLLAASDAALAAAAALANDIYIAQNPSGAADGSSCANTYPVTFFNTVGNWGGGPGQIGPGTIVHLCGIITTELTAQGDGSSGSPILILFQPNAQIRVPLCDDTNGCVSLNYRNHIILDGGTACGPGTACATTATACARNPALCGTGSIVQTSNGTLPAAITNITCSAGVATVAGPSPFGFSLPTSSPVTISGNSITGYNGTWAVASNDDTNNTFTFNVPCGGTGVGGLAGVNCPSGSFCAYNQAAIIVNAQEGCANCEVRNLILGPLGFGTSYQPGAAGPGSVWGTVYFAGCNGCTTKIHDSVMPFGQINYVPASAGDNGLQIYNNEIFNFNGAINIASSASTNVLTGAQIHDNYLHDAAAADAPGCPAHHDGIHVWGLNGGYNSGINFYNNRISGNFGGCATGAVFFEGANRDVQMYNNVVNITYTQENNGVVNVNGDGAGGGYDIYNNTIIGDSNQDICFVIGGPGNSVRFENNILTGCWTTFLVQNGTTVLTWDYNIYGCQNLAGAACGNIGSSNFVTNNGGYKWMSLAGWKATCACDSHSTANYGTTWLAINPAGTLQPSSPAIGAGANLTALNLAPLRYDLWGYARPANGAWTVGAFSLMATTGPPPAPPTGLTAVAH
ncbi:MAG: hypothetical protein WBW33_12750 [Bryobacteraceae bacterium]